VSAGIAGGCCGVVSVAPGDDGVAGWSGGATGASLSPDAAGDIAGGGDIAGDAAGVWADGAAVGSGGVCAPATPAVISKPAAMTMAAAVALLRHVEKRRTSPLLCTSVLPDLQLAGSLKPSRTSQPNAHPEGVDRPSTRRSSLSCK
jgi:hypothetical protein